MRSGADKSGFEERLAAWKAASQSVAKHFQVRCIDSELLLLCASAVFLCLLMLMLAFVASPACACVRALEQDVAATVSGHASIAEVHAAIRAKLQR